MVKIMDDLTGQLNKILSDPQSMAQIQNMMSGLGLGQNNPQQQNEAQPAPQNSNENIIQNLQNVFNQSNSPQSSSAINGGDMVAMMSKIAPLLGTIQQDDDSTRLLSTLKPMLSSERQEKITQAIRILQLMKLMPLLKESGMLSSILGGLF